MDPLCGFIYVATHESLLTQQWAISVGGNNIESSDGLTSRRDPQSILFTPDSELSLHQEIPIVASVLRLVYLLGVVLVDNILLFARGWAPSELIVIHTQRPEIILEPRVP